MPNLFRRLVSDLIARRPEAAFDLDDPRLAVAALMFHVISVDGRVTPNEKSRWEEELARRVRLSTEGGRAPPAAGRAAGRETPDPPRFPPPPPPNLSHEERLDLVRGLWILVLADGVIQEFEDNVVWRIAGLLGVEARDRMILRKEVEAEHEAATLRAAEDAR